MDFSIALWIIAVTLGLCVGDRPKSTAEVSEGAVACVIMVLMLASVIYFFFSIVFFG